VNKDSSLFQGKALIISVTAARCLYYR